MVLYPLPAFTDNYIWVLHDGQRALVVDPGESSGVLDYLATHHLVLETILVTHHHHDHVGGVADLHSRTGARVVAPATEWLVNQPPGVQRVRQGDAIESLGLRWQVLDVPGHTAGHVAYVCEQVACNDNGPPAPVLFCGDTLFSGGCGRLFEGTPAQMLASLDALAALPDDTLVCCTHEYTLGNLKFALAVEPGNAELQQWQRICQGLRAQQLPTLPAQMGRERMINPFLRVRTPAVRHAVSTPDSLAHDDVAVFAALREWKNRF